MAGPGLAPNDNRRLVLGMIGALLLVAVVGTWVVVREGARGRGAAAGGGEDVDPMVRGEQVYGLCANCHGRDGGGQVGRAPALLGSRFLGVRDLVRVIRHGFRSDQPTRWTERMTGAPALVDGDVAALVLWVRARFAGEEAVVEAEAVRALRLRDGRRMKPWSPAELPFPPEEKIGPR